MQPSSSPFNWLTSWASVDRPLATVCRSLLESLNKPRLMFHTSSFRVVPMVRFFGGIECHYGVCLCVSVWIWRSFSDDARPVDPGSVVRLPGKVKILLLPLWTPTGWLLVYSHVVVSRSSSWCRFWYHWICPSDACEEERSRTSPHSLLPVPSGQDGGNK